MPEGPIRADEPRADNLAIERKPTADFPALNDDQIVWMAENSTGTAATWAQSTCTALSLDFDATKTAEDPSHTQRVTGLAAGMEYGSRRPSSNCPELTGEQISELASGAGEYAEWAQWAEKQN